MKIVYLANARIPTPRAYGLQIMKTCEGFVAAGAQVELVAPERKFRSEEEPFNYYGVEKTFALRTLQVPDFLAYGPIGFFFSALWFSEKARSLKSFLESDIVYSRDALVLIQYVLLSCRLVFEVHAKPSFISRIVARRADKVIAISHGLRKAYEAAGVSPAKIVVAPDAVDMGLFEGVSDRVSARHALDLAIEEKIVLYAGHLYPRKGADILAAAAALVPETRFVFVGGAPDDVVAFRERWQNQSNIQILGHQPHEKIPLYLRAADVLALPNSGSDEDSARFSSPMKLFEYMASGTPIVASDVPALREILDGTSAVLVPSDDPDVLAQGILRVFTNKAEAQECASEALRRVEEHTWGKRAAMILAHLK